MNEISQTKLKTNLDTDLLKIIGIITMLIDHIGSEFFPDMMIFRIIGRMTFPIFSYCLVVGMIYTRDIKKYFIRLGAFAIISQPFWILAFNADDFMGNILNLNIFFSLIVNLLGLWAIKERKWWLLVLSIALITILGVDYSNTGIILMMIFYFCRNKPVLGASIYTLSYLPAMFGQTLGNYFTVAIGDYPINISFFAILAVPLIFISTNSKIKMSKWIFYIFYPAHLLGIYLVGLFI